MTQQTLQIAIDGPVAAGKGTVAKLLAERLGLLYVDTGAMYRCVALLSQRHHIEPDDEEALSQLVAKTDIQLRKPNETEQDNRLSTVLLSGEDVSWEIRTPEIGRLVPTVAALPRIRALLVEKQQRIAKTQGVVMEGRDITYRVLPGAQIKIYLTANDSERAMRRLQDMQKTNKDATYEEVLADLIARDTQDMKREADPLKIIPEAWVLDTTGLSIETVVDRIEERVKQLEGN